MSRIKGEWVFKKIDGTLTAVPVDLPFGFTVEIRDATSIESSSATLNAELTSLLRVDQVDVYFAWRRAGEDPPVFETSKQTISSTGTFSENISGLASTTIYEFYAKAETTNNNISTRINTFKTT